MYRFSDVTYFTQGNYGDIPVESKYLNIPICMVFIELRQIILTILCFHICTIFFFNCFFRHNDGTYHYTGTYEPTQYVPVLDEENAYADFLLTFKKKLMESE